MVAISYFYLLIDQSSLFIYKQLSHILGDLPTDAIHENYDQTVRNLETLLGLEREINVKGRDIIRNNLREIHFLKMGHGNIRKIILNETLNEIKVEAMYLFLEVEFRKCSIGVTGHRLWYILSYGQLEPSAHLI